MTGIEKAVEAYVEEKVDIHFAEDINPIDEASQDQLRLMGEDFKNGLELGLKIMLSAIDDVYLKETLNSFKYLDINTINREIVYEAIKKYLNT